MMKIRIISDIHRCINSSYPISIKDDVYTLIAGDMGPDYTDNIKWIRDNITNGAFISGNHDAYTNKTTIDDVKNIYHREFPLDSNITYFDSDVGVLEKRLDDNTILIADVLYTDYAMKILDSDKSLKKHEIVNLNMSRANPIYGGYGLNDFHFTTNKGTYSKADWFDGLKHGVYYITPKNYLSHFNSTFKKITKIIEEHKSDNIILMTHHCISERCIDERFKNDDLNGSYVSPKDKWILKHPNIKLIVSGHIHTRMNFHIGNTLYVTNPLGYVCRGEFYKKGKFGMDFWSPNCFVDTDDWKMTYDDSRENELRNVFKLMI